MKNYLYGIIIFLLISLYARVYSTTCAQFDYQTEGYDLVFIGYNISSEIRKTKARPDDYKGLFFEQHKTIANFDIDNVIKGPSLEMVTIESSEYQLGLGGLGNLEGKLYVKANLVGDKYISNNCIIGEYKSTSTFLIYVYVILIFGILLGYLYLIKNKSTNYNK